MKVIDYIERNHYDIFKSKEDNLKRQRQSEKRELLLLKEQEEHLAKTLKLKKRMAQMFKKEGKVQMPRSEKRVIKKEVTVVKVDQETLDRQRYLGEFQTQQD